MTENEIRERADAQVETCRACRFLNLDNYDNRWCCNSSQKFPGPPQEGGMYGVWGKCFVANSADHYALYNGGRYATLYLSDPCPGFIRRRQHEHAGVARHD